MNPEPEASLSDSAENLMTDCNVVNVTTELNNEDDIKPSVNVKEVSYFNIFECGRNLLDKLDVTYQRAFTASEKTSREARIETCNRVKQESPSQAVSPATSSHESPMSDRYWKEQKTILTERMVRKEKGLINESLKYSTHERSEERRAYCT